MNSKTLAKLIPPNHGQMFYTFVVK